MSKTGFSKTDNRRIVMALAVVAMFLATMGVSNVQAVSPVSISADQTTFDIMEGEKITATVTITSTDEEYTTMNLYLSLNWLGGVEWNSKLTDANYDSLPGNQITLPKKGTATVLLTVTCGSNCDSGDTNTVQLVGRSDPKWSGGGNLGCSGSSDCLTDTTPASASSNTTNTVTFTLNARTGTSHTLDCEDVHNGGSVDVYQGIAYDVKYTLTNTGWNTDNYQFSSTVTSDSGADVSGWTSSTGLVDGKELTGVDTSLTGVSEAVSAIGFTPSLTARPGTYTIEMVVSSNNGGAAQNCEFYAIVPQPDLEIKNTDIDFSHTSAWINTRGDTQTVTVYATVRNNGGNIDTTGVSTNEVTVKFYADSTPIGTSQVISLKHGEEEEISVDWNPSRAHTSDEVGLVVTVKADPSSDIEESDEANNEASQFFKVVRTKSSTPSFFMGFFALIGSVAVAVMLSSYYRNKDSEE